MTVKEFKDKLSKFDDNMEVEFIERYKYIDVEYFFGNEIIEENGKILILKDVDF